MIVVFLGGEGGEGGRVKGQKVTYDYQFQSVTLYISRIVDHIMKIVGTQYNIMLSPGVFLYFFIFVNIKILTFFIDSLQQLF